MTKETAELISRLNASRDTLKGLNIGGYALIREARDVMSDAANGLYACAKTFARIEEIDRRVVEVLMWMDERGRNSQSFGSHADAYEIAARRLREALGNLSDRQGSNANTSEDGQLRDEPSSPTQEGADDNVGARDNVSIGRCYVCGEPAFGYIWDVNSDLPACPSHDTGGGL